MHTLLPRHEVFFAPFSTFNVDVRCMQATCSNAPNAPKDPSIRSNTTQLPPKSENQNPAGPTLHAPIFFSHSPVFSAQLLPRTLQYSFSQGNTQKSHHHGTRSRTNCCPKACAPLPATGVIWLIWAFDVVIGRMPFLSGIVSDFFASNGLIMRVSHASRLAFRTRLFGLWSL